MSRFELLSPEGLRVDGRRSKELRKLKSRMGLLECDGSAYLQLGNTKVIVQCHGPQSLRREAPELTVEFEISSFAGSSMANRGRKSRELLELANVVQRTFRPLLLNVHGSRSGIHLHIHVLQSDGGILACALNACCLALIDAGIPLLDFVSSVSVGMVTPKGSKPESILDLNYIEENQEVPNVTIGIMRSTGKIAVMQVYISCFLI